MTLLLPELTSTFRAVSARVGADRMHVQGAGGNTSLKLDADSMLVKASGYLLKDAEHKDMFARVAFERVREALATAAADPLRGSFDDAGLRPSIEATLHALLPHRVVLHTHSLAVLRAACLEDSRQLLHAALAGVPWAFVEYQRPGTPLALAVQRALVDRPDTCVLVLENHGVVVGADTPLAAEAVLDQVCARLNGPRRAVTQAPDLEALATLAQRHGLVLPSDPEVHGLALHPRHVALAQAGTLYPDHVVFLGPKVGVLSVDDAQPAPGEALTPGSPMGPKLWLVPGSGALLARDLSAPALEMARCLADLVSLLPDAAVCRYLSAHDEAELLGMEEEKYRQALARRLS